MRYKIALVWILVFIMLWLALYKVLNINQMRSELDGLITGIEKNDWKLVKEYNEKFHEEFHRKKFILQINNATEIYITFEHTVEQLDLAVRNRQESALEYAGLLRGSLNYVVNPFSGP